MFFFEQILGAVCYVHSKGMMHRDLKPSNIFFSFDGSIKVGDFGLVAGDFDEYKQIQPPLSPRDGVSRSNSGKGRTGNVGTHLYMSPEQVQEGYIYDEKVDIFALGIILYEMNHPFATEMERTKVLESVKKGQIPPEFAERLLMEHELIVWLLNTNPLMRPSAGEIASSEKLAKLKTVVSSLSPEEECLQYL
jgi:translation initiation factor 2-alpha kinase 3